MLLFIVEGAKGMTKHASLFRDAFVEHLRESVIRVEELLKYLVGIVAESISSFQFSFCKKTFLEFLPPVLIVECSFDRIAEDFVSFRDL